MASKASAPKPKKSKPWVPIGVPALDAMAVNEHPVLTDYVKAVSEYVVASTTLAAGPSKQAQIHLSLGLGRALRDELKARIPEMNPIAGETTLAGALRNAQADVSDSHYLDGVRLAIEIKPINLAVGRAIWNRFGDIRAFAVNVHLKFPFAVVGAVLAVPIWEWADPGKKDLENAEIDIHDDPDELELPDDHDHDVDPLEAEEIEELAASPTKVKVKKSTTHLIDRLVRRLARTRKRQSEADAPHLFEAVTVIVYDPDTGEILDDVPPPGTGLRWDEFVDALVENYELRFEN